MRSSVDRQSHCLVTTQAFTLAELLCLVAVMAAVIAVLLPAALSRRYHHCYINCSNNLKQIGLAFRTWSIDNRDRLPMAVSTNEGGTMELVKSGLAYQQFAVMSNELSTPKILRCPEDKSRTFAANFSLGLGNTNLSYFVGLDATETNAAMLLSGDRHLTNAMPLIRGKLYLYTNYTAGWTGELHRGAAGAQNVPAGYLLLADGSVHLENSRGLNARIRVSGARNRLAMP